MKHLFHQVLSGFGRRIGWVLAGLLLLALGISGRAEAHNDHACYPKEQTTCSDAQAEAQARLYDNAVAHINDTMYAGNQDAFGWSLIVTNVTRGVDAEGRVYWTNQIELRNGPTVIGLGGDTYWVKEQTCTAGKVLSSGSYSTAAGQVCHDGCVYENVQGGGSGYGVPLEPNKTIDGVKYYDVSGYATTQNTMSCSSEDLVTPPVDTDNDGKSDGNDPAPNNPGDSGGNGPNPPGGGSNNNGDGSGNGNRSSGGGTCASPPSSSGDQIGAMIAYQAWATRCAIENAKNSDGSLKTAPPGGGTGSGNGNGNGNGTATDMGPTNGILNAIKGAIDGNKSVVEAIKDHFTNWETDAAFEAEINGLISGSEEEPPQDEDEDPTEGLKQVETSATWIDKLDSTGFLGGGNCPADRSVQVGPSSIPLSFGPLCQLLSAVSGLVMAAAYLIAFRILAS